MKLITSNILSLLVIVHLLIIMSAYYFDDSVIIIQSLNTDGGNLRDYYFELGSPVGYYFHKIFLYSNNILSYKILSFFNILGLCLALNYFLYKINIPSKVRDTFLFLIISCPIYINYGDPIYVPYLTFLTLLFTGFNVFYFKKGIISYIVGLPILILSLFVQSHLVYLYLILGFTILYEYFQLNKKIKLSLKHISLFLIPLIFKTVDSIFHHENTYNKISFSFQSFLEHQIISHINLVKIMLEYFNYYFEDDVSQKKWLLLILLIISGIIFWKLRVKTPLLLLKNNAQKYLLLVFGIIFFEIAIFPFSVVGKDGSFRNPILLIAISIIIYSFSAFLKKNQRIFLSIYTILSIFLRLTVPLVNEGNFQKIKNLMTSIQTNLPMENSSTVIILQNTSDIRSYRRGYCLLHYSLTNYYYQFNSINTKTHSVQLFNEYQSHYYDKITTFCKQFPPAYSRVMLCNNDYKNSTFYKVYYSFLNESDINYWLNRFREKPLNFLEEIRIEKYTPHVTNSDN